MLVKRRIGILVLVGTVAGLWGGWMACRTPHVEDAGLPAEERQIESALHVVNDWRPLPGYVGSHACRTCHSEQFDTYLETAHSRALADVDPAREPPDATFDHAASDRWFRVTRRDGRLVHEESLPLDDGTEFVLTSMPLQYRIGSGHFARTYLCDAGGGFLMESPVTWYEPARKWGMSPGYDKAEHKSFSRQAVEHCLFCHAGHVATSATSNYRLRLIENSIGCERCHGPGAAHIERQAAGHQPHDAADESIINPRRLSRKLSEAICQQCHLQGDINVAGRDVRPADYRPGMPLEDFRIVFRLRHQQHGMTVVGHVEQLAESACYRRSETLTCVTCHNPHVPVASPAKVEHFRSVCMNCHEDRGCKVPLSRREEKSQNDCAHCHMPKAATEVPHLAFTHHRIGIHPLQDESMGLPSSDALVPISDLSAFSEADRKRILALARTQMLLARGLDFQGAPAQPATFRQIEEMLRDLPREAVDTQVEVARAEVKFRRGDLQGAEQSALRALNRDDIRSEEAVNLLEALGTFELRQHRFEEARRHFAKLVQLRCHAEDWFQLGMCENQCGRPDLAIRPLERARELAPAQTEIHEALAGIYERRQEFDAAHRLREDVARMNRRASRTPEP